MSRGLTFALDQLNPRLRAQAQRKLDSLPPAMRAQAERQLGASRTRNARARRNRPPLIPKLSNPAERLAMHLRADGLTGFVREYRFHAKRQWRFDFAFLRERLGIEVNGGIHQQGRHTRGKGYERDREKVNEAVILGWRVLEFTPSHVKSGKAVRGIQRALDAFRTELQR